MVARIKKNDTVLVLSGSDKDKQGTVLEVLPINDKIMVKDVAIKTRHLKPRRQGDVAGIKKTEGYINASKVMPICPSCNKPCRINVEQKNDKRVRVCNRCNNSF